MNMSLGRIPLIALATAFALAALMVIAAYNPMATADNAMSPQAQGQVQPTDTPTPTATPTNTPEPTATPTNTPEPTATPTNGNGDAY